MNLLGEGGGEGGGRGRREGGREGGEGWRGRRGISLTPPRARH